MHPTLNRPCCRYIRRPVDHTVTPAGDPLSTCDKCTEERTAAFMVSLRRKEHAKLVSERSKKKTCARTSYRKGQTWKASVYTTFHKAQRVCVLCQPVTKWKARRCLCASRRATREEQQRGKAASSLDRQGTRNHEATSIEHKATSTDDDDDDDSTTTYRASAQTTCMRVLTSSRGQ